MNVKNAIKQFSRRYASYDGIKKFLYNNGYALVIYTDNDIEDLIIKYQLSEDVKKYNAFTINEEEFKAVYINKKLSAESKIYSLLHEVGHIVLNHLERDIEITNERLKEMQAEAFAYGILSKLFKELLCY